MMEPTSNPNIGPTTPSQPESGSALPTERRQETGAPETQPKTPERGREQLPNPETSQPSQAMVLPPVQTPVVPAPSSTSAGSASATNDDMPLIADDVDVIEMEWVNKAKKIIKDTRNDPHAQEEAVEQLQIDYLKKRYGKEIKKSRSK